MERYKIIGAEAFGLLVISSPAVNRKLRDVADHLVASGELLTLSDSQHSVPDLITSTRCHQLSHISGRPGQEGPSVGAGRPSALPAGEGQLRPR
jgi:hypothetical protein